MLFLKNAIEANMVDTNQTLFILANLHFVPVPSLVCPICRFFCLPSDVFFLIRRAFKAFCLEKKE